MNQLSETLIARRDRLLGENTPLFMMLRSFTYLSWWNEQHNEFGMSAYIEPVIADARAATVEFFKSANR